MKSKQLGILVAAAVALVLVGLVVHRGREKSWKGRKEAGGEILAGFVANDVASVKITGPGEAPLVLKRTDDAWVVDGRYGYRANYETLRDLMVTLTDLRAVQTLTVGESNYGRLDLKASGDGGGVGTTLELRGEGDTVLHTLFLGKEHQRKTDAPAGPMGGPGAFPDGRYLRRDGMPDVFLVDETFSSVSADPSSWLDKEFFKIGDMQSATMRRGDEALWEVSRDDKSGTMALAGEIPEGKELDTSALSSISNAFSWASFTDVMDPNADPGDLGMDAPHVFTAREFDGIVYTVTIGKVGDDGHYVSVEAAYDGPAERPPVDNESEEDAKTKDDEFAKTLKESRDKVAALNARLDGWVYGVSKYTVDSVLKTRDDLLKDEPKPETEEDAGEDAGAAAPAP